MSKIIRNVEDNDYPYSTAKVLNEHSSTYMGDAVCGSAVYLAEKTNAVGIISMTSSGYTAFEISSYRPKAATFIFTSNRKLLNTLSLLWGVRGFYYDKFDSTDKTIRDVNQILKAEKLVESGQIVINTASIPIEKKGKTNMIKVTIVD
jgi:pyruvate kinase